MRVGLRPVIQILCHVLARGWGRWLRYFTEAKAEVKYRASARIRGPKHNTRFEWPVSILIMTRYPFLPFKTHKTTTINPRLLTIAGAIWFCRYRQCTPSQLWMHAPVAKLQNSSSCETQRKAASEICTRFAFDIVFAQICIFIILLWYEWSTSKNEPWSFKYMRPTR